MLASKLFCKFIIIYLHLKTMMFFVLVPTLKSSYWHRSDRGWRRTIFAFYEVSVVSSAITTVVSTLKMGHWLVRSIRSGEIIVYAERLGIPRSADDARSLILMTDGHRLSAHLTNNVSGIHSLRRAFSSRIGSRFPHPSLSKNTGDFGKLRFCRWHWCVLRVFNLFKVSSEVSGVYHQQLFGRFVSRDYYPETQLSRVPSAFGFWGFQALRRGFDRWWITLLFVFWDPSLLYSRFHLFSPIHKLRENY